MRSRPQHSCREYATLCYTSNPIFFRLSIFDLGSGTGVEVWNKRGENIKYAPLSVVPDFRALDCFDWQGAQRPPSFGLGVRRWMVLTLRIASHPDPFPKQYCRLGQSSRKMSFEIPSQSEFVLKQKVMRVSFGPASRTHGQILYESHENTWDAEGCWHKDG